MPRQNAPNRPRIGVRPYLEFLKWGLTPIRGSIGAFGLIGVAVGAVAASAQPSGTRRVAGLSYDLRMTSAPTSGTGLATAMGNVAQSYAGHALVANGRGRLDITEGGMQPLFVKGDYLLFDSTGITVVKPASQEYIPVSAELNNSKIFDQMQAMGVAMSIADLKVAMDSLAGTDTVAGYPTRHFRMTLAFTMSIDASFMQQRFASESITDYWVATVPGLPSNPLLRINGVGSSAAPMGAFKEMTAKVDSAAARLGNAAALKTKTVSRMIQGPGANMTTEQTSEVSNIQHTAVDEAALVVPAGYRRASLGG